MTRFLLLYFLIVRASLEQIYPAYVEEKFWDAVSAEKSAKAEAPKTAMSIFKFCQ